MNCFTHITFGAFYGKSREKTWEVTASQKERGHGVCACPHGLCMPLSACVHMCARLSPRLCCWSREESAHGETGRSWGKRGILSLGSLRLCRTSHRGFLGCYRTSDLLPLFKSKPFFFKPSCISLCLCSLSYRIIPVF